MHRSYVLLATLLLFIACAPARAQEVRWEQPSDLEKFYMQMAADSGGAIYTLGNPRSDREPHSSEAWPFSRSTDNGTTWSGNNNLSFLLPFALACDGPGSVYAGSPEGLHHSTDGGETWAQVTAVGWNIMAIGVGPGGTLLAGAEEGIVYRSTDRGITWGADTLDAPANVLNFLFAGDGSIVLATYNSIYRSTDDGISWTLSNDGIDPSASAAWWAKPALAAAPWGDLYVAYLASIYRSTNNGMSWEKMEKTWPGRLVTTIFPTAQGEMFLGTAPNGGVLRSTDRGVTWEQTAGNLTSIDPGYMPINVTQMFMTHSGVIVAATDSAGVIRTVTSDVAGVSESVVAGEGRAVTAAVHPNPAASAATIRVTLPHAGHLRAELVNSYGEAVASVQDALLAGGDHSLPLQMGELSDGIYFCRLLFDGASVVIAPIHVVH
jgi:photosystem II stability/assembly factor-like uncharacterized protein